MLTLIAQDSKKKNRTVVVDGFVKPSGTKCASVTNDRGEKYNVQVKANGETSCGCKGHEHTGHCYHAHVVSTTDLPTFEQVTAYSVAEAMAEADEQMRAFDHEVSAPEVRQPAPTFAYGCCGHLVKPQFENDLCPACLFGK